MRFLPILLICLGFWACDDGDGGTEAQRHGIGAGCATADDCADEADAGLACLPFKGGYCGARDCTSDRECPSGSACIDFEGARYCFLICADKPECNRYRAAEDEANCSANQTFVDDRAGRKVCVPPSGS